MAEILGLGVTHYPPLSGLDDNLTAVFRNALATRCCRRSCATRPTGRTGRAPNGRATRVAQRDGHTAPSCVKGSAARAPRWTRSSPTSC